MSLASRTLLGSRVGICWGLFLEASRGGPFEGPRRLHFGPKSRSPLCRPPLVQQIALGGVDLDAAGGGEAAASRIEIYRSKGNL